MITKPMKRDISFYKRCLGNRTNSGHIINYLNGFISVGVLKVPRRHIKSFNTLWVFGVGFDKKGKKIIENMNLEMTLDEAKDLLKCLRIAIKKYKSQK